MTITLDPFKALIGNESVRNYLKQIVAKQRLGNSLLFAGLEGVGKFQFAKALAELLICQGTPTHLQKLRHGSHPDLHVYRPEGRSGMHSIDALRALSQEVFLAPHEAKWKIFIIDDAHRMLLSSANALLKTFEEPAPDSLIILVTHLPQQILGTVRSRCRQIYFQPIPEPLICSWIKNEKNIPEKDAKLCARIARGSLAKALCFLNDDQVTLHKNILKALSKGKFKSYCQLKELSEQVQCYMDETRKNAEKKLKKQLAQSNLNTKQKETLEKEIEGMQSIHFLQEVDVLLETILFWYRDLHLLKEGGPTDCLLYSNYKKELHELSKHPIVSLDCIQNHIFDANLAVERYLPIRSVIETLFLKLNLI